MKKVAIILGLILLFSATFVSAGFFSNLWGQITGNVVAGDEASIHRQKACNANNLLEDDGEFAGLARGSRNGRKLIDNVYVTSCIKVPLESIKNISQISVKYKTVNRICGDSCSSGYCSKSGTGEVFVKIDDVYDHVCKLPRNRTLTTESCATSVAGVSEILVCRDGGSYSRGNLAVDYVDYVVAESTVNDSAGNEPIACTNDVLECSDGSFVSRDINNNCEFTDCPVVNDSVIDEPVVNDSAGNESVINDSAEIYRPKVCNADNILDDNGIYAGLARGSRNSRTIIDGVYATSCIEVQLNDVKNLSEINVKYKTINRICGDGCISRYCKKSGTGNVFVKVDDSYNHVCKLPRRGSLGVENCTTNTTGISGILVCRDGGSYSRANLAIDYVDYAVAESVVNDSAGNESVINDSADNNNVKNMALYSDKHAFLVSDSDWHNVLPLVPVTTWTQQENDSTNCQRGYGTPDDVCVYPTLIYHEQEQKSDIQIKAEDFSLSISRPGFSMSVLPFNAFSVTEGESFEVNVSVSSEMEGISFSYLRIFYPGYLQPDNNHIFNSDTFSNTETRYYSFTFTFLGFHNSFDADSTIHFLQQYSPDKVTISGSTPQELDNLLIAEPVLGAGLGVNQIQRINANSYLDYWESYKEVVYVEDNYELALMASTYASLINAPLIIEGSNLDDNFNERGVICVGNVNKNCNETYNLKQLQQKYIDITNTEKIVFINPNDLSLRTLEEFQPEKSENPIYNLYSKTSLSAPILAAVRKQILLFTDDPDYVRSNNSLKESIKELNLNPEYLTIIAAPNGIEMTKDNPNIEDWHQGNPLKEEVDNHIYGKINPGLFQDLAVGRIFSISTSDVSSYIARDVLYNRVDHTKNFTAIWVPNFVNMKVALKALEKLLISGGYNSLSYYSDESEDIDIGDFLKSTQDNFLITYGDHAWTDGWSIFSSYNLRQNNIWLNSPLMFSEGCGTCAWDLAYSKNRLFCSEVIRRGAVGYFGATTDASAPNWDTNPMFYNELVSNVDIGTASKNVRNRAITQAYEISQWNPGAYLGPYDSWNLLIGDPLFKINLGLSYPQDKTVNIEGKVNQDNYVLNINIPSSEKNVNTTLYFSWPPPKRSEIKSFEYPFGKNINRFHIGFSTSYIISNEEIVSQGQGCYEWNEYTLKVDNIPGNKNISSVTEIRYTDNVKNNVQINFMPVYGPQEGGESWNLANNSIRYYRNFETGEYYIYLSETLSYKIGEFTEDEDGNGHLSGYSPDSILICNETTLPERNYTITFSLEDSQ